ncbi:MAG: hypothetical protein ASARMPREDX12_001847 [Alectoria sarmentosa]|nr:MAG: hypothetical protein ASARMPREDX12_001847 [Alectoria sarmentosa]CAD6593469.1 MAG: hypothetical protein ASARMPRED_007563 [Alectoria sarmentosa]
MPLWRSNVRLARLSLPCPYSVSAPGGPAPTPALLVKVRNDIKAAMKAKDSSRLDVLRGLISDVTNAAKTSNPVTTDAHMLKMIRKRVKSSEAAVEEFQSAKRDDLKSREVAQIAVLEGYIGDSGSMGEDDIARAIQSVIGRLRSEEKIVNQGSVMKSLVGTGGTLEDQSVDKQVVAKLVKGML